MPCKLSLVVPCFNEQDNIFPFYKACKTAFEGKIESYNIIFVNDGSRDNTMSELKELYRQDNSITVIGFSRNFGKEAAMLAGLQKADGDYVSIIDADLQQRPETVLEMVKILDEKPEYDCVAAYQEKRSEGAVQAFAKKCFYKLINKISEVHLHPDASDFRTFRQSVAKTIRSLPEYHRFSKGIFAWIGYNTFFMPYVACQRNAGKTNWSFIKLIKYSLEGITAYSVSFLKLPLYFGISFSVISFVYAAVRLIIGAAHNNLSFSADLLVALIVFLWGTLMTSIGILGIYISKIYIQDKGRPVYIVKDYLSKNEDSF